MACLWWRVPGAAGSSRPAGPRRRGGGLITGRSRRRSQIETASPVLADPWPRWTMSRGGQRSRAPQRRMAMTTTAMGLFDGFSEAQHLIHPLVAQGIRSEDITIIANRAETAVSDVLV